MVTESNSKSEYLKMDTTVECGGQSEQPNQCRKREDRNVFRDFQVRKRRCRSTRPGTLVMTNLDDNLHECGKKH